MSGSQTHECTSPKFFAEEMLPEFLEFLEKFSCRFPPRSREHAVAANLLPRRIQVQAPFALEKNN